MYSVDNRNNTKMNNKTIVITGANSGLGFETAKQLAKQQHELILLCRNKEKGEQAVADIKMFSNNNNIHLYTANLASQKSIEAAAIKIGIKAEILASTSKTSSANRTPAIGVLNAPAIPAATPLAKSRVLSL